MIKKFGKIKNSAQILLSILFIFAVFIWIASTSQNKADTNSNLKVYFLNVGQGDSEYIKNPDGTDILIDGGPDNSVLAELGKVMNFGDREINLVVLTHPHADHMDGLNEVLKRYQVDEVWQSGVVHPSSGYDEFKNIIKSKNIENKFVKAGDEKDFGQIKFLVLAPLSDLQNKTIDNVNNASVVNRLEFNRFSALFMGDMELNAQTQLISQLQKTTVIKIAHHGSSNGVNENFLKIVRPAVAIISAGKNNKYGHPTAIAINLLKSLAI